jgi:hypothetical protein
VFPAAGPQSTERTDTAPHKQDETDTDQQRPVVEGKADSEKDRSDEGADDETVVTSEEKQHGMASFLVVTSSDGLRLVMSRSR